MFQKGRKIILSTSIGQTSLTFTNLTDVIDSGLTNLPCLQSLDPCAHALPCEVDEGHRECSSRMPKLTAVRAALVSRVGTALAVES